MPSVKQNLLVWDKNYDWTEDGDEWDDQAKFCGEDYIEWKNNLVSTFITPYINKQSHVLEIGPGRGRWVEQYIDRIGEAVLVDVSPNCIEYCKEKFSQYKNINYMVNDGRKIDGIEDHSIDFVWTYDVFVHIEIYAIRSYLSELHRVVRPGGIIVIHHADQNEVLLRLKFYLFDKMGRYGKWFNKILCHPQKGWRSFVSRRMILKSAEKEGLNILYQTDSWGDNGKYNCKLFHDKITVMKNPEVEI